MSEETETTAFEREPLPGESEYALARQMPHNVIPDFATDEEYLTLLGQSAAQEFPRALSKLADYAMRRGTLVEAYYWLYRARRVGVRGLDAPLRQIRRQWAAYQYPTEDYNRHDLFTDDVAAAALALLDLSVGRNRLEAQAFLMENCPELLG